MTDTQWEVELAATLVGTDWVIMWYGVIQQYPCCLADVHNEITRAYKQIDLSRDDFRTPESRRAEVYRQLSD